MQTFEFLLTIAVLALLTLQCFFGRKRALLKYSVLSALLVFLLHLILEGPRWQMALVYLPLALLCPLFFRRSIGHLFFRLTGFMASLLIISISIFYAVSMPIVALEPPTGSHSVGVLKKTITDDTRTEERHKRPGDKRRLLLEIWYPGEPTALSKPESLWSGLYSGKNDLISFFTEYLRKVKTNAYSNIAPKKGSFPLVLFNHGLQMFTSQNTQLMEHLASHGYIVVSIAHPYESIRVDLGNDTIILPEFVTSMEKFKEGMQWIRDASAPMEKAKKALEKINDRTKRSALVLDVIENADGLNGSVSVWAKDNQFVLDWLTQYPKNGSNIVSHINFDKIGIMGMSMGGATAGEICKIDERFDAGINMDGLQYGTRGKDSLHLPFLMFYSDDGLGLNDAMYLSSTNDYYECHIPGTRHTDFTDLGTVWPILGVYGQLGELPSNKVTRIVNTVVLDFWDRYLKGKPNRMGLNGSFPELIIETKFASEKLEP